MYNRLCLIGGVALGLEVFDERAKEYDGWFDEKGKLIFEMEVNAIEHAIVGLAGRMLEVGVGSGRFAARLGVSYGIDPSFRLLGIAANRGIKVVLGEGEYLPFRENAFDVAFMIVTICFVADPIAVLREVNRVLSTDGHVVLGLVLAESPWGKFYLQKKAQSHPFYQYANFYTFSQVKEMLKTSGFEVDGVVSILFQSPGEVVEIEQPREGYCPDAGFTIVVGRAEM